ncbi:MAG: Lrp/AsnC ligand binding domain-containing protein [Candidatus Thorarchaeota archaeon]
MQSIRPLKPKEQQLLALLLHDSRSTTSELGEELEKGRNWVARKIKKLVNERILRAYITVFNPAKVYAESSTILLLKSNPREEVISRLLLQMSELESLDGISGEHSLLGLFRFRQAGAFSDFLDRIDEIVARSEAKTYNLVQVLTTYKTHGFKLDVDDTPITPLTAKEWNLLNVIHRQQPTERHPSSLSQREIGQKMSPEISQPSVSKTISDLIDKNVIIGQSIDLDFSYVGLPVKFFLQIKPSPGTIGETAEYVSSMDEVWDLHRTGEEYCLFATVRAASVDEYNRFLRTLYQNENVLDTKSQISLEEWFVPASTLPSS